MLLLERVVEKLRSALEAFKNDEMTERQKEQVLYMAQVGFDLIENKKHVRGGEETTFADGI